ncbi:MAG: hypothetical protein ACTSPT_07840 [Candidatus Heimdallarchaeota archaeon]
MKMRKNIVKVIFILAIISILPFQLARSETLAGTIISAAITEPTIDGVMSAGEWDDDKNVQIRLDHLTNPGMYIMINVKSTYDLAAGSVSFGITVPDPDADMDALMLIFKTNTNDLLINTTTFGFGKDQDIKGLHCAMNYTIDGVSIEGSLSALEDSSLGGTNDGTGACTFASSKYTIELTYPLASGDTDGKDFSLVEHDLLPFSIMYFENMMDGFYTQINTTSSDLGYCILSIGNPLSGLFGIGSLVLYTSLISSMIVFVAIKRRRK